MRRRSQRVFLSVAVTVQHEGGGDNPPFTEETHTFVVNAHGALIGLAAKIEKGQILTLKNLATREEQACAVVYLGPTFGGKAQIGVEFTSRSPDFWRITFPPEDWNAPPQAPGIRSNKSS